MGTVSQNSLQNSWLSCVTQNIICVIENYFTSSDHTTGYLWHRTFQRPIDFYY